MPIVIARTGDILPVSSGTDTERRSSAWAQIVKNWAERNEEQFREMLETGKQPEMPGD